MKRLFVFFLILSLYFVSTEIGYSQDIWRNRVVPTYMAVMGVGIAGQWTMDIAGGKIEGGFFEAKENGLLFWPHWTAEYLTAASLLAGAYGLYTEEEWGRTVSLVSLGALAYTSLNHLNWALAEEGRLGYAIPMFVGLVGSGVSIGILF